MFRFCLIAPLLLAVGVSAEEGSLRRLQEGHPCNTPEFTMDCDPAEASSDEIRARFCDADGSVLDDGIPRSICVGVSTLPLLVTDVDYCGFCVPPVVLPSLASVTPAPVTGAPIVPAQTTSSPVTSAPITVKPVTASPVTSAPVTAAPSGSSFPSSAPSDVPSVSTPSPSGSSMPSIEPSSVPTVPVPATSAPSGSSFPSSKPSDVPSVSLPLTLSPTASPSTSAPTATPLGAATDPPVFNSFSKENPACNVCGEGKQVGNIMAEFFLPGNNPPIQCGEFQLLGALGRIPPFLCGATLTQVFVAPNCGCVDGP